MARQKISPADSMLIWAATAPLAEVEAQYRRVGAILSSRRSPAKRQRTPKATLPTGHLVSQSDVLLAGAKMLVAAD